MEIEIYFIGESYKDKIKLEYEKIDDDCLKIKDVFMRRFHNLDNNIDILNIKMKKDNKCTEYEYEFETDDSDDLVWEANCYVKGSDFSVYAENTEILDKENLFGTWNIFIMLNILGTNIPYP
jgi:hypothetical protein